MRQIVTTGIVLARTNFGEADRILTVLTPDNGKVRLMARGVRKIKSKLAGGIELFSISQITFIPGRGEISTLVSTRLLKHYGKIVQDIDRTMFGYDLLKTVNNATEDGAGREYFGLLQSALEALDEDVELELIRLWLHMQLLKLGGHAPNLKTDKSGNKLAENQNYAFSFDDMAFLPSSAGSYKARHIKLLRLAMSLALPSKLQKVQGISNTLKADVRLAKDMLRLFVRV